MLLHVPPGIDFTFVMRLPIWDQGDVKSADSQRESSRSYDMHINILSVVVVLRVYIFLRILRNRIGFRSPRAAYIGKENGVLTESVSFALKLLLKKQPWTTIVTGTVANVVITSGLMW